MFSKKDGTAIAYVKDYKKDALRISDKKTRDDKDRSHVSLHGDNVYTPLLNSQERDVTYICGPSGSGKSTIAAKLIKEWKKDYPEGEVYIFSRTDAKDDPAFKKIHGLRQVTIDSNLVENPIVIEEEIEPNSLVLFDDVGTIRDVPIRKEVEHIMSDIMEVGRKMRIWIIITSHLIIPNEKKFARTVLNEAQKLVVFPRGGAAQQIVYALKTYFGYTNKQIAKFLNTESRWLLFSKTYPMYVLSDQEAIIP